MSARKENANRSAHRVRMRYGGNGVSVIYGSGGIQVDQVRQVIDRLRARRRPAILALKTFPELQLGDLIAVDYWGRS